jgi:hypothetical protein
MGVVGVGAAREILFFGIRGCLSALPGLAQFTHIPRRNSLGKFVWRRYFAALYHAPYG